MLQVFFLTMGVLVLCFIFLGLGLVFKRRPLRKRCSADPLESCRCQDGGCDRTSGRDLTAGKF